MLLKIILISGVMSVSSCSDEKELKARHSTGKKENAVATGSTDAKSDSNPASPVSTSSPTTQANANAQGKFAVTVLEGSGGGDYTVGQNVTITALDKNGQIFKEWSGSEVSLLTDKTQKSQTFAMPNKQVSLTATYSARNFDKCSGELPRYLLYRF